MADRKSKPKRTKKYTPKTMTRDPITMAMAMQRQAYLSDEERETVMREARPSFERLRRGEATKQDWCYLADAANVGEALSKLGICSDAPSMELMLTMQLALKSFAERVNARGIWTATGKEIVAVKDGLDRHEIQLMYTTLPDLKKAVALVESNVRAARAGRMTTVTLIEGGIGMKFGSVRGGA
jgi:hypothetical protein